MINVKSLLLSKNQDLVFIAGSSSEIIQRGGEEGIISCLLLNNEFNHLKTRNFGVENGAIHQMLPSQISEKNKFYLGFLNCLMMVYFDSEDFIIEKTILLDRSDLLIDFCLVDGDALYVNTEASEIKCVQFY